MSAADERFLGLLSDTHGRADACREALRVLGDLGATAFVHCGDVCGTDVLDALAGERVWFVWGNNDLDRKKETRYAESIGLTCLGDLGRFAFGGKHFVVTHGDDARRVVRLCADAENGVVPAGAERPDDYLLSGPHPRLARPAVRGDALDQPRRALPRKAQNLRAARRRDRHAHAARAGDLIAVAVVSRRCWQSGRRPNTMPAAKGVAGSGRLVVNCLSSGS